MPRFPFYKPYLGGAFSQLPIMDKAILMAKLELCNTGELSAEFIRRSLSEGLEQAGGLLFGQSTGTSGNRGYYVISEKERYVWLGTILAKTLPDALLRKHRVAIALPGMSSLYSAANAGGRISLAFFDTTAGIHTWEDDLARFAPDTIVAPPKALRYLADRGKLTATNIFSGAEILDPLDREVIERVTGVTMREIYMATEGLLGVSCPHGSLHLAEDVVHFEWEDAVPGGALKKPIITDFTRGAQAMVRYRMNDLLELSDAPCPCGSVFQRVKAVHGRADDIFLLPNASGEMVTITPDILRNTIIDADGAISDFRAVQTARDHIRIELPSAVPKQVRLTVESDLASALTRLGAQARITTISGIATDIAKKLRRVRREWRE